MRKIIVSRDVKFDEVARQNLDKLEQEQVYAEEKKPELQVDDVIDDKLIRGTKSLIEECVMTECTVVG